MAATFDDSLQRSGTYTGSGPLPAVQNIASAKAYLGTMPWEVGAVPLTMNAADGVFNAPREEAYVDIDTTGLSSGKHLVLVQGRDAAGNDGPASATFLNVAGLDEVFTLQGRVVSAQTQAPLAASIRIDTFETASDSLDGVYSQRLPQGVWNVEASAPDHAPSQISGIVGQAGELITQDFQLYRYCELVNDPVELKIDSPFTPQAPWARINISSDERTAWLPKSAATGQYANNLNVSLSSALLDFSSVEHAVLSFDQRCQTESGYDYGIIEVRRDAGAWAELARCSGESSWQHVELDVSQLLGSNAAEIRFRFTSDSSVTGWGWGLDNIALKVMGDGCRSAQQGPDVFSDGFEGEIGR